MTATIEDELIRRARSSSKEAEALEIHRSQRVRSAAKAALLKRDRDRAVLLSSDLKALRSVEVIEDFSAWQRDVDRAVAEVDRWSASLRPESKKEMAAELKSLAAQRSALSEDGKAAAKRSHAAYSHAVEVAAKARSRTETLYALSFCIWGFSALLVMAPNMAPLAFLLWLGSLVLWLVTRQEREALKKPDAWRRFYDPNGTSTASGTATRTTKPPANWFPDPHGKNRWRYWDGHRWTEHTAD